jgi:hypothetical protein
VQSGHQLLNARFFDRKGAQISGGSFKDGNGKLIVNYKPTDRMIYSFYNGKLNDTTLRIVDNKVRGIFIFKDNVLVKQDWRWNCRIISNYDEHGFAHDSTFVYGDPPVGMFRLFNPYRGKLYMVNIYEHGHLKEQIFYRKNGSIKSKTALKYIPKDYYKKPFKNCL